MSQKTYYLIGQGTPKTEGISIEADQPLSEALKAASRIFAEGSNDLHLFLEDAEESLSLEKSAGESGIAEKALLVFARCKEITVHIIYVGRTVTLDKQRPSFKLKKVKQEVGKELGIPQQDLSKLKFKKSADGDYLNNNTVLASLLGGDSCELTLHLVEESKIQGFTDRSKVLVSQHVDVADFQLATSRREYGLQRPVEQSWPFIYCWIQQNQNRFYLRLDLNGYPEQAPLGRLWDMEADVILPVAKRPTGNQQIQVASRMEFGGQPQPVCLYIPCDRGALQVHPDWKSKYPERTWKAGDTLDKYLRVYYDILNS